MFIWPKSCVRITKLVIQYMSSPAVVSLIRVVRPLQRLHSQRRVLLRRKRPVWPLRSRHRVSLMDLPRDSVIIMLQLFHCTALEDWSRIFGVCALIAAHRTHTDADNTGLILVS